MCVSLSLFYSNDVSEVCELLRDIEKIILIKLYAEKTDMHTLDDNLSDIKKKLTKYWTMNQRGRQAS